MTAQGSISGVPVEDLTPGVQAELSRLSDENALLRASMAELRARLEEMERSSEKDALTGLPNRRAYEVAVDRRVTMSGGAVRDCLAVLDIDHFKVINDSFGHAAGDEILRGFARVARGTLRDRDMVARIGGEEFAILFPDTSVEQAMLICDRLRTEIAHSSLYSGMTGVRVTVSGGVAPLGKAGLEQALQTADQALYRAKRDGRDRLAIAA